MKEFQFLITFHKPFCPWISVAKKICLLFLVKKNLLEKEIPLSLSLWFPLLRKHISFSSISFKQSFHHQKIVFCLKSPWSHYLSTLKLGRVGQGQWLTLITGISMIIERGWKRKKSPVFGCRAIESIEWFPTLAHFKIFKTESCKRMVTKAWDEVISPLFELTYIQFLFLADTKIYTSTLVFLWFN